jgi:hypothetical protein
MKHVLIVVVALCALVAMGGPATPGEVHQFVGLWEAVDPDDGGPPGAFDHGQWGRNSEAARL